MTFGGGAGESWEALDDRPHVWVLGRRPQPAPRLAHGALCMWCRPPPCPARPSQMGLPRPPLLCMRGPRGASSLGPQMPLGHFSTLDHKQRSVGRDRACLAHL